MIVSRYRKFSSCRVGGLKVFQKCLYYLSLAIILCGLGGCAGKDKAWDSVALRLAGSHDAKNSELTDRAKYLSAFGNPFSNEIIQDYTQEVYDYDQVYGPVSRLIWLMDAKGTELSSQPNLGWELLGDFTEREKFIKQDWGNYRTPLDLKQIIDHTTLEQNSQEFYYALGLAWNQHGLEVYRNSRLSNLPKRGHKLAYLQLAAKFLRHVSLIASVPTLKIEDRLATEKEVLQVIVADPNFRTFIPALMDSKTPLANLADELEKREKRTIEKAFSAALLKVRESRAAEEEREFYNWLWSLPFLKSNATLE